MALKGFTKLCIAKNFKQKQRIFRFSFSPSENVKEPLLISFTRVFCLESNTVCLNYVYFISLIKSQTRNPHINQSTASRTIVCRYHRLDTNEHVAITWMLRTIKFFLNWRKIRWIQQIQGSHKSLKHELSRFKDPLPYLCFAGCVVASCSLTREVAGLNNLLYNIFLTEFIQLFLYIDL